MIETLRASPLARLAGTAFLVLLLQIPIGLISGTIDERRTTRDGAIQEVTGTWGGAQQLAGPILTVPVIARVTRKGVISEVEAGVHRFLPRMLNVSGTATTETRRRGIFEVPLFVGSLQVEAVFQPPEEKAFLAANERLDWKGAVLSLGLSDPRAIQSASKIAWEPGKDLGWEPGPGVGGIPLKLGVHAPVPGAHPGSMRVSFDLALAGSGRLSIVPAGDDTRVALRSSWPDPGFDGAWLPDSRSVGSNGFTATWHTSNLARGFPSHWQGEAVDANHLSASDFGVRFLAPVDAYRTNERAVKYQLLFLGLTFLCFTLIELLGRLRLHPVHYLLVGLALCVFYLLLLSLSEQIGFDAAYAVAAAAVVALIGFYLRTVLASRGRCIAVAGFLSGLYGFLFVLLQIQDYALLVGSVGLFAALGGTMWLTRRIDWYAVRPLAAPAEKPAALPADGAG